MKTTKQEHKKRTGRTGSPILQIKGLNSWYGQVQILHDVHLQVHPREMVCIIGPNGAGKSTILKNIFGLIAKNQGEILFEGKTIRKMAPEKVVRHGISIVPQGRSVFPSLTVRENLELGAYIRAGSESASIEQDIRKIFDKFPKLKERQHQKAGLLSGGEQQMVAIGRALMIKPKLLLLDEPSLGLSPQMKQVIFEKIVEINRKDGIAVLVVEQNARLSLALSDYAYVLELGHNRLEGDAKRLLKDKRVAKLYLGGA